MRGQRGLMEIKLMRRHLDVRRESTMVVTSCWLPGRW